jgi:hypothetical protein
MVVSVDVGGKTKSEKTLEIMRQSAIVDIGGRLLGRTENP